MVWPAYLLLLAVWVLFVPAAVSAAPPARTWARVAVALGLAGAVWELFMSVVWGPSVVGPIRIDLFLVFGVLAAVYLLAGWSLGRAGWTRSGGAAGLVALAASGAMGIAMAQTAAEVARLDALRSEGNRLLFEAKFADRTAYAAYFAAEPGGALDTALPVGHWAARDRGPLTRLVVGSDGRLFVFFRCGDTECQFGPGTPLAAEGDGWAAHLIWRGVGQRHVVLGRAPGDVLPVRVDDRERVFERRPPPLLERPRGESLAYLGAFSAVAPARQHVRVVQLWLWRGEDSLLAVGVLRTLVPGRRADFVAPLVLGSGVRDGEAWVFRWSEERHGPGEARVRLREDGVELALPGRDDTWPRFLAPEPVFRDDVIELAARGSEQEWRHWLDTLLVAHAVAGEIPTP